MNKCLRITLTLELTPQAQQTIKNHARLLGVEGIMQVIDNDKVKVIVCGNIQKVDDFIDTIHRELQKNNAEVLEVEPFIKERDYRGVFRVIE
jgi:acylphosphatase